jgi:hypothetical protein
MARRALITITTETLYDERHALTLDTPRGDWSLNDLHELARTAAESVGILGEHATAVDISVSYPEDLEATLLARLRRLTTRCGGR